MSSALEFTYMESPRPMQGVMFGVFYITTGVGNLLGSALINIVNAATKNGKYAGDVMVITS